ncbi:XRE family transcriptional regulator [Streptomyces violaceoruber]|uniref:XRE family transcriptional regulator n=1 Tax=Streptomyces violaceoruber TaxID=1935 RepID=UPI001F2EB1F2|nr:XRE family transcriptional regulator [Streptomyces violaceoruber]MCF3168297.1 XRE family transcriptional regulator [Streptomyces violaceoruber]
MLDDARLLGACAERDMGTLFRLLNHRGVSTRRLAAAIDITQGRLYDYMNGKSRVEKLVLFEQIADALHLPGHLLGLARRPWEPVAEVTPAPQGQLDPDRGDLLAMNAFRSADRQIGGGRLYQAVVRHLGAHVAPRLVGTDGGPRIFAAAAALTEMAGWMAHDSGQDGLAAQHFTRAFSLARTSGDLPLSAHVAASSSHLALQIGEAGQAVHWARAGFELVRRGPRIPVLVARLYAMQARALASALQHTSAHRALESARDALGTSADDEHPWLSPFDEAALTSESALILHDLGREAQALSCAENAVRLREECRTRSLAMSRITLAGMYVQRREFDAAIQVGNDLLGTSLALASVRVQHQLGLLHDHLTPHRAHAPVREYLERFEDARRARMLLMADIVPPEGGIPT